MRHTLVCLTLACSFCLLGGADWLQYRGTSNNPIAPTSKLPLTWSDKENVAWKMPIPGRGVSSPIVVGDRVVVTCNDGVNQQQLLVLCFDVKSGKRLWSRKFWATGRTYSHPTSAVAAPSPASDGKRIFAFFSSNDLICLDLEGNLLWYRGLAHDYPKAGNDIGMASSPLVIDDTVVVQIENQGDSFATGINTQTGESRWRVERTAHANWASPIALPGQGERKTVVLLQSPSGLTAHDPSTGKQVWSYDEMCSGVASAVAVGDRVFLPSNGLTVLKFTDQSASPEIEWEASKLNPGSGGPIIYKDRVYAVNGGVLKCGAVEDGKILWQLRIQGRHWATPIIAGNRMYLIDNKGVAKVVELGDKGKIIGESDFGETVMGTPAVSGNSLFVRSANHLWKISSP